MQAIVPQLVKRSALLLRRLFASLLPAAVVVLSACSTVQLQASKPVVPSTLNEAKAYVESRDQQLQFLEYELNERSRACYKKFFVSSCVDDVRLQGAEIRRAHLEVQGKADDMIRLDGYANRKSRSAN